MATGLLERTKQNDVSLKAYGKLSGGVEPVDFTEEQRAFDFNSKISENYQKLINPDYRGADDIADSRAAESAQPVFATQEEYAMATLYPERLQEQGQEQLQEQQQTAPRFEHHRVTSDLFRADSPMNSQTAYAEPALQSAPVYEEQGYAEEIESADLKPTETTIQYRTDLYREEKQTVTEERKGALSAKGKLLMAIYAIVVVVVLALIIVNTSVLRTLDSEMALKEAQLSASIARYEEVLENVEIATSEDTILAWGEANGMYKPQ